eukprot:GHVU01081725.1.p1 GENE.GHVU01081725.1~~GHVU01081725.1.p1  ORF type:complete len:274 (+),score=43.75 GHVU01081725.1:297-1118(+)
MRSWFGDDHRHDDPFTVTCCCYSMAFCGKGSSTELEKGNKVILPSSALQNLARRNVSWPMLFKVSNYDAPSHFTHVGVQEFSADEGTCYIPYWLIKQLQLSEGDKLDVVNVKLPKGSYVKLQPCSTNFLDIANPRVVLETALRPFAALSQGDRIAIEYNDDTFEIEVLETRPSGAVSVIETDVEVDFAPPKDYVEPPRPPPAAAAASSSSSSATKAPSKGLEASTAPQTQQQTRRASAIPAKRLPGGVRTTNAEYEELIRTGKIPGIIGKRLC